MSMTMAAGFTPAGESYDGRTCDIFGSDYKPLAEADWTSPCCTGSDARVGNFGALVHRGLTVRSTQRTERPAGAPSEPGADDRSATPEWLAPAWRPRYGLGGAELTVRPCRCRPTLRLFALRTREGGGRAAGSD
jgi:hypothetical protein